MRGTAAMRLEQYYGITPAALAFGLRVLAGPAVRAPCAGSALRGHRA